MQDANFEDEVANAAILKLTNELQVPPPRCAHIRT